MRYFNILLMLSLRNLIFLQLKKNFSLICCQLDLSHDNEWPENIISLQSQIFYFMYSTATYNLTD